MPESESKQADAIDLSKYVPKDQADQLKADLEKTKLELLSPEYLEFQETKRNKATPSVKAKVSELLGTLKPEEIESLSKRDLLEIAVARTSEKLTAELGKEFGARLAKLTDHMSGLTMYVELDRTKKAHSDFDDYKDDIDKILEKADRDLTFEEAYLQAKGAKASLPDKKDEKKEESKPKGSEKPGGATPPDGALPQKFKDADAAGRAAFETVKAKYGITGDSI